MKRITSIEFAHFKAFYGEGAHNKILIPQGKNVWIYGENGSGKSSIYEGLKQFFYSLKDSSLTASKNIHSTAEEEAAVKVTFTNEANESEEKVFPHSESTPYLAKAALLNSFFSYRELLKTYLIDKTKFVEQFTILMVEEILGNTTNGITGKFFKKEWDDLFRSGPHKTTKERELVNFVKGLEREIQRINLILNELLFYFDPNLYVEIQHEDGYVEYGYTPKAGKEVLYPEYQIWLNVKLFGKTLPAENESHLTILNEARLSSLALAIYLASLINTTQSNFAYKILFLDDIFIGLDMSNRLPLLAILNDFRKPVFVQLVGEDENVIEKIKENNGEKEYEIEPFFNGYQIFMTTYDRNWYEVAKGYVGNNWHTVEMYAHFDEAQGFEVPFIMPSEGYYEKALAYFKKNKDYKDYPAAANYLRKECEQQFKRILYGNYLLKNGKNGTTELREELNDLKTSFDKLLKDLGLNSVVYTNFGIVSKSVLNPLSHDNLQKPIYKKELQEAFELIDKLRSLKKEVFLRKDASIYLQTEKDGILRTTTFKVASEGFVYTQNNDKKTSPIWLKPLHYEEVGVETTLKHIKECSIEKGYDQVHHAVFGTKEASKGMDMLAAFTIDSGKTLLEL